MNVHDLIYKIKNLNLKDLVPIETIKTKNDIESYQKKGYSVTLLDDFKKIPNLEPYFSHLYYQSENGFCEILYYNLVECALFNTGIFVDETGVKILQNNTANSIKITLEHIKKGLMDNDITKVLLLIPDAYKIEFVFQAIYYFPVSCRYQALFQAYMYSDYGFSKVNDEILKDIVSKKSLEEKENTYQKMKDYNDMIHVYRGIGDKSTEFGYSYTVDKNIARFFAFRHSVEAERVVILEGDIEKKNVIEFIDERDEQEIIAFPDSIKNTRINHYYGVSVILNIYPNILDIYKKQKKYLDDYLKSEGLPCNDRHNESHLLRVLVLSILLAEHYKVKKSLKPILYNAAMFHDIGRDNDLEDEEHGAVSYKKLCDYKKSYNNLLLKKLITYHCKKDDLSIFSEDEAILYKILKDADALDRQRLGLKELDESYLRLDYSHELLFFAFQLNYYQM